MGFTTVLNQAFSIVMHLVVIEGMMHPPNFKEALGFYGAYHQDPVNQAIHFVFVPIILWTAFLWFAYIDIFGFKMNVFGHRVSWATTQFLLYFTYYNTLDPFGGRIFSLVILAMYLSATHLVSKELKNKQKVGPNAKASSGKGIEIWQIAGLVHVFSWYMQIHPGHGIYEGVKPALLDSFGQSLTVAPLFAFYEGIWFAGFAQEMHQEVANAVAAERHRLCASGATFNFCN